MSDTYEGMGELHDLFMIDVWDALRPALVETFAHLGTDTTILDIGAGTGLGTRALAQSTAAHVVAVEPSPIMRAVLLARVVDDPALVERVSVFAGAVPDILDDVTGPVSGFVCAHMLGHLTPGQREATFARLRGMLSPGGVGLITLPRPGAPTGEETVEEATRIGGHRYLARHRSRPGGAGSTSEYLVLDGDRVLRRHAFVASWQAPTLDQLRSELDRAGLRLAGGSDDVVGLVRHVGAVA
ncbi:class I SAM-dependent methyltransferase [Microbacterium marinilacus]|uniref:class I SAM-dependent methyltransferase n=1 Tax=Microbacterium marinilacus TaxID=415209 RepID=UPI001C8E1F31|nr:class I SAM-dependent methyltransferase [Microbacterium marinilacus]MBY0687662.1 class I SAM-dependent methyltransferase [Microbacterium marinilacus]